MKELYTAPEAEIIYFAPVEKLAWQTFDDGLSPNIPIPGPGDEDEEGV